MKRVYVDMDGTLAVFQPCDTLEKLYERSYFRNLAPQEEILNAVKKLIADPELDVYVLSAVLSDSEYALSEKNEWLDEFLPELDASHRVFTPCGDDKTKYIDLQPSDLLLDDYTHNLLDWEPPGVGVKILNGINHINETWTGNAVNGLAKSQGIYEKIKGISQGEFCKDLKPQIEEELQSFLDSIVHEHKQGFSHSSFHKTIGSYDVVIKRIEQPLHNNHSNIDYGNVFTNEYAVNIASLSDISSKKSFIVNVNELKENVLKSFTELHGIEKAAVSHPTASLRR